MTNQIIVEKIESPVQKEVVIEITNIHKASFKRFFLSYLGSGFLFYLYSSIANDKNGILLIGKNSEKIVGFVAGVIDQKEFYESLIKKHKWKFAIASIPAVLRRPNIIPRLFRAFRKPKEAEKYSSNTCLLSIAVHPRYQGMGIGEILVREFSYEVIKRGYKTFCLTTDRDNNEKVNEFYKKMGFKLARTFVTPEGRTMNEYLKILK